MFTSKNSLRLGGLLLLGGVFVGGMGIACAETPARNDRESLQKPVHRVAHKSDDSPTAPAEAQAQNAGGENAAAQTAPGQTEHPLEPALKIAYSCLDHIKNDIKDYSATLYKRERIDNKLGDTEKMFIKVRNQPLSVYMYFLSPESLKGQECLYVAGKNDGNMIAHGVGLQKMIGTVRIKPDSMIAMRNQRYPITEIGILNLTKRLIQVAEQDKQFGECEVQFTKGAKVNGRVCTTIEVIHPHPRRNFRFHKARVFVDDELNVPIRYEAYEWPAQAGGKPPLLEEYTYTDLKLNNDFTDKDFDEHNTSYGF